MTSLRKPLLVGRLRISYDRGTEKNRAPDLGLEQAPQATPDGGLVRGLGSHWRSEQDKERAAWMASEEHRIRKEFSRRYLSAPIPGLYLLRDAHEARAYVASLQLPEGLEVRLVHYTLAAPDGLPAEEINEWLTRVRSQLAGAPLGRGKQASVEGLAVLRQLASCPALGAATKEALENLVVQAEASEGLDRVELKRRLGDLVIDAGVPTISPRRAAAKLVMEKEATHIPAI